MHENPIKSYTKSILFTPTNRFSNIGSNRPKYTTYDGKSNQVYHAI